MKKFMQKKRRKDKNYEVTENNYEIARKFIYKKNITYFIR